jgi:hypothetical protein
VPGSRPAKPASSASIEAAWRTRPVVAQALVLAAPRLVGTIGALPPRCGPSPLLIRPARLAFPVLSPNWLRSVNLPSPPNWVRFVNLPSAPNWVRSVTCLSNPRIGFVPSTRRRPPIGFVPSICLRPQTGFVPSPAFRTPELGSFRQPAVVLQLGSFRQPAFGPQTWVRFVNLLQPPKLGSFRQLWARPPIGFVPSARPKSQPTPHRPPVYNQCA